MTSLGTCSSSSAERGNKKGLFKTVSAIDQTSDGPIYIVDSSRHRVDPVPYDALWRPSPVGVQLYVEGRYTEAEQLWHEVLRYNANYDMACDAIGKALYKAERYKEAMEYFHLAQDKQRCFAAFKEYRKEMMREHLESCSLQRRDYSSCFASCCRG